jgi:Tol biopolymer transport system component
VLTPDRKKIVFSTEVDEPGYEEGPPTAVYVYDIAGKSTIRLSPKGYYGMGVIIRNNKVLFSGGKVTSTIENIYTVDLDGKNLKVLFPNANTISAKN